jgi:hypothetical protein
MITDVSWIDEVVECSDVPGAANQLIQLRPATPTLLAPSRSGRLLRCRSIGRTVTAIVLRALTPQTGRRFGITYADCIRKGSFWIQLSYAFRVVTARVHAAGIDDQPTNSFGRLRDERNDTLARDGQRTISS